MTQLFYVYALLRPPKMGGHGPYAPFYIGKGKGSRATAHLRYSKTETTHKSAIVRKLFHDLGIVPFSILRMGLTENEAFEWERLYISIYGRESNNTGVLTNLTDGGDGASGAKHSALTKRKMSESAKAAATEEVRTRRADGLRAYLATPEGRESRVSNAEKMHATLGPDWLSSRNKRVGAERNKANEPIARKVRCLLAQGVNANRIAKQLGISVGSSYRYCGPIFAHLDCQ